MPRLLQGDGQACTLPGDGQVASAQGGSWSALCTDKPLVALVVCFPIQLVPILPRGTQSPVNPGAHVGGCVLRAGSTLAWLALVGPTLTSM